MIKNYKEKISLWVKLRVETFFKIRFNFKPCCKKIKIDVQAWKVETLVAYFKGDF